MSTWDNTALGAAATVDAASRVDDALVDALGLGDTWLGRNVRANNTNLAAEVYADQVDRGGESYSRTLDFAAPEVRRELAHAAATEAVAQGALSSAARSTYDMVVRGVTRHAKLGLGLLLVGGGAVVAWKVLR